MIAEVTRDLVDAGLISPEARLVPLSGGVSCQVWRIAAADTSADLRERSPHGVVVKAPLATLRTPALWQVDTSRGFAEAEALQWYAERTPEAVPQVLWRHSSAPVVMLEAAPPEWVEWREQMLAASAESALLSPDRLSLIGADLGRTLATWHRESHDVDALPEILRTGDRLRALRTDPFHRATARELPQIAGELDSLAMELENARICLVHGDFSPKNVLVGPPEVFGAWMLDAEVAHVGDPVLDIAYLSTHLVCKAVARPDLATSLDAARVAFERAYRHGGCTLDQDRWSRHTGAILAARVRGVSRVSYLSADQQQLVLDRATALVRAECSLDELWADLR